MHTFLHRFHNPDIAKLALRVALGVVFIVAGWMKISNMEFVVTMFGTVGIPAAFAYIVSYGEFIAGIALLLGVFAMYAASFVAVVMLVATFMVHWPNGFSLANGGYEYNFVLLLVALAVVMLGAGRYALVKNT